MGFLLLHCGLPLWIGGWIYLLFRSETLLMFDWAESIGILEWIYALRQDWGHWRQALPQWVLFSLPDGAWVYCATAFFGRLWRSGPLVPHVFWSSMAFVLAAGGELAQWPGWIPGTFDAMDLVLYGIAAAVSYWVAAIR